MAGILSAFMSRRGRLLLKAAMFTGHCDHETRIDIISDPADIFNRPGIEEPKHKKLDAKDKSKSGE